MKQIYHLLFVMMLITLNSTDVFASHAAGGELVYEHVPGTPPNQYLFTFKFYRDCSGIAAPTSVTMCYTNDCGAGSTNVTLPLYTGLIPNYGGVTPPGYPNGHEVTELCPPNVSKCASTTSPYPGYQEWWYQGTVTLPTQCKFWRFYVSISARNPAITNLVPALGNLFISASLDNVAAQGNSSPYFTNPPVPFFCNLLPAYYNNGAIDPDNDSLSFESIQPATGSSCGPPVNINYVAAAPPFTPLNPFSVLPGTFSVNPTSGATTFTPNGLQVVVITVLVREWRFGVQIGHVMRDIQINIINCPPITPSTFNFDPVVYGGTLIPSPPRIELCAGDSVHFCFAATNPNPAAILKLSDIHVTSPTATVSYVGQGTNNVTGCFAWRTTALDTGTHNIIIKVRDSTCASGYVLSNSYTMQLHVNPITTVFKDTEICLGGSAPLFAYGGTVFNWNVLPGGDPVTTLSCNPCNNPIATPTQTTTYVVTSNLASAFCPKNKDTVTIKVATGPTLTITPDTTTCSNAQLQLNVNAMPNTQPYIYSWSPTTFLSNPNIKNPVMQFPTASTSYTVTVVPAGVLACASTATVNVNVLTGFNFTNKDTTICDGASVTINGTGSPQYTYTWTPPLFVSNPTIVNPVITPPQPIPNVPNTSYTYTLTAEYPGCPDSTKSIKIDVEPIPQVYAGRDTIICPGQKVQLNGQYSPISPNFTLSWTPPSSMSDPTIINPVFFNYATQWVGFFVTTPHGCTESDSLIINVDNPNFMLVDGDRTLCPNETTFLRVVGNAIWHEWSPADFILNSKNADTIFVKPPTSTKYTVYGINNLGCKDTQWAYVTVNPGAVIDAGEEKTIYPGESVELFGNGNCSFFNWSPPYALNYTNIKNPIASPAVTTRYYVKGKTENGCEAIDSEDVRVSPESLLELPNAFSPGPGSSVNDQLTIIVRGLATLKSFKIFNRWGQLVFETSDIKKGWDGRYKGVPQPMGSYVYTLDAVTGNGKKVFKKGNVTLFR